MTTWIVVVEAYDPVAHGDADSVKTSRSDVGNVALGDESVVVVLQVGTDCVRVNCLGDGSVLALAGVVVSYSLPEVSGVGHPVFGHQPSSEIHPDAGYVAVADAVLAGCESSSAASTLNRTNSAAGSRPGPSSLG